MYNPKGNLYNFRDLGGLRLKDGGTARRKFAPSANND